MAETPEHPTPKRIGFVRSWGEHIRESTKEHDGKTPSSARIYAGWLIGFVIFLQFASTIVILLKILWVRQDNIMAPALITSYTALLRVMLLWGTLFDVATALSLYGINVWKYIASFASPLTAATTGVAQGVVSGLRGSEPPVEDAVAGETPTPVTLQPQAADTQSDVDEDRT